MYQCGRGGAGIHARVTNKKHESGDTHFGQYPWQVAILKKVSLQRHHEYVCGGTLIDEHHILTAAHCIHG